ncbi:MAG: Uma2 family endonuclease [Geminocystis sp.]|nr:Uma2 family endonuclease [Geminocystis sp.]HIK38285.1 Uma2 family endonuclease [Geminocystis sp. M7585_C2015_104]MCS7148066.1 Uma2 family endonuclease [Geminocystis sp.]MCX8077810.1 Uma2 family endonuclease [Geminocystis sp.]MDW8116418.1 Uma2 family endonuclease [Geminocystis sp.]
MTEEVGLEKFLQLPETQPPLEYLEGEIIQKPIPSFKEVVVRHRLLTKLNNVASSDSSWRAFLELRCTFNGQSLVPDIVVLTEEHLNTNESHRTQVPPDWSIDLFSPEQSQTIILKRVIRCLEAGTQLAWVIDIEEKTIFVYFPQKVVFFDKEEDLLPTPPFVSSVSLTGGEIFSWLYF